MRLCRLGCLALVDARFVDIGPQRARNQQLFTSYMCLSLGTLRSDSFRKSIEASQDNYGDADVGLGATLIDHTKIDRASRDARPEYSNRLSSPCQHPHAAENYFRFAQRY
jgi:hypothetical protein